MKFSLVIVPLLALTPFALGQSFSGQNALTTDSGAYQNVFASDLDGDGDLDLLSASQTHGIDWYENHGGGVVTMKAKIADLQSGADSVYATDLDGDGDADVLSASKGDSEVRWFENLGGGCFGPGQIVTDQATGASCVFATDLDGDGDADVLSASNLDDKIAWYENLGGGLIGPKS